MTHSEFLGLKIELVLRSWIRQYRDPLQDVYPLIPQILELLRVVGHEFDTVYFEKLQHIHYISVIALIYLKTESKVGFDSIVTLFLQVVGLDLVQETDPSPLLA